MIKKKKSRLEIAATLINMRLENENLLRDTQAKLHNYSAASMHNTIGTGLLIALKIVTDEIYFEKSEKSKGVK